MGGTTIDAPTVAILTAPGEGLPPGIEQLEDRAQLWHATELSELRDALVEADILLITDFRSSIVEDAFPAARRLRWVHATSAGVDALMFPALADSNIPITNARGIFDQAIAETVLGFVLAFAKDLPRTLELQREHEWQHRDTERVREQHALVIGAGSIGRSIAQLLGATGMRVTGLARHARHDDPDFADVRASGELDELLAEADYVIIAAPLTESTRGMFGAEQFQRMRSSARLINIGRGPIVQTDALVDALRDGAIGGAALDVFEQEPLPADHPLWELPHVILSHHMAGDFIGWRRALTDQFVDNFHRWQTGEPLENVVDKRRGYVPQGK